MRAETNLGVQVPAVDPAVFQADMEHDHHQDVEEEVDAVAGGVGVVAEEGDEEDVEEVVVQEVMRARRHPNLSKPLLAEKSQLWILPMRPQKILRMRMVHGQYRGVGCAFTGHCGTGHRRWRTPTARTTRPLLWPLDCRYTRLMVAVPQ